MPRPSPCFLVWIVALAPSSPITPPSLFGISPLLLTTEMRNIEMFYWDHVTVLDLDLKIWTSTANGKLLIGVWPSILFRDVSYCSLIPWL